MPCLRDFSEAGGILPPQLQERFGVLFCFHLFRFGFRFRFDFRSCVRIFIHNQPQIIRFFAFLYQNVW